MIKTTKMTTGISTRTTTIGTIITDVNHAAEVVRPLPLGIAYTGGGGSHMQGICVHWNVLGDVNICL